VITTAPIRNGRPESGNEETGKKRGLTRKSEKRIGAAERDGSQTSGKNSKNACAHHCSAWVGRRSRENWEGSKGGKQRGEGSRKRKRKES